MEDNMKLRAIASLVIAIALASGASAQSVGVFFDPNGATCAVNQPAGASGTMYILATLGGGSSGGMTGAEFRVDNFPANWFANIVPNPAANLVLGGPLAAGCNIAFPTCQIGMGGIVTLYTVTYFATDLQSNRHLAVLRHTTPSNANFQCPLQTLCDSPV